MHRLTVRELWAHKLRFALTGLAVVLGVAFMAGTMVLTDTMNKTFGDLFASANADVDVVVQRPETVDAEWGDVRGRVPAEVVDRVAAVDGVELAVGSVQGFAQLVKADGTVAATDGVGTTIGSNWIDAELSPFDLAAGRRPDGPDEAVLDRATAEREGWSIGDTFTVLTRVGPRDLTMVGTATMGDLEGLPGSSVIAVDDPTAQELFGQPGTYDLVMAAGGDGVDPTVLAADVDAALRGDGLEVRTGAEETEAETSQFEEDLSFFNQFLLAFAYVSLFVGVFIIYNTFSIVVTQRTKDMAMLRAIGAGRGQILRSVVIEAVAVGFVASAVGLAGGVVMSMGLRALLGAVGLDIPSGDLVVSGGTVMTAFVVGVTVTILSALAPAVRAGRVAPIAALRDVHDDRSATSVARLVAGLVITGLGICGFAAGVVGDTTDAVQLLGLGALAVVVGVVVLGPVIARPVVTVLGWPTSRLLAVSGKLARENARRSPKRTAATASALMIGVALVGFITILAASTKDSVASAVDRSMRADYVIDSGTWGAGGFSPSLGDDIAALPEVATVSAFRSTPVEVDGHATEVQAVDTAVIDDLVDLEVTSGEIDAVRDGSVAVHLDEATERGLRLGDPVEVEFPSGPTTLTVRAIYDEPIAGAGDGSSYLVDVSTLEAHVTDRLDAKLYVGLVDDVTAADARTAIDAAVAEYPNADVQDQAEFKEGITSEIDRMLNLIYGLLALAVVIALIGIANTLALSVHERTRELGLLRAVGMTRAQLRSSIRLESVLIALLGTGLGAALAVAGAWGIVSALGSEGVTTFTVPPSQMAVIIGLAGVAGVVAALGPARRASRLNVLDAISHE